VKWAAKEQVWYYKNDIKQKRHKNRDVTEDRYFHNSKRPDISPEQEKLYAKNGMYVSWLNS